MLAQVMSWLHSDVLCSVEIVMNTIVLATPHSRNDPMVESISRQLPGFRIVRVKRVEELTPMNLDKHRPRWIFFPHWSWMIPDSVFNNFPCVVFHMTDLPYGRGGSPLQNLIIRGHKKTKLSALKCVKDLDAGPIYLKRSLVLSGSAEEILRRASDLMVEMVIKIVREEPQPKEQVGDVIIFNRRRPADSNISELRSLDEIYDHIRMLDADGYPPAFVERNGVIYEFSEAENNGQYIDAKVRIKRREKQ